MAQPRQNPYLYQNTPNQAQNGAAGGNQTLPNQAAQTPPPRTGGNAFESMVNHATALNQAAHPPLDPTNRMALRVYQNQSRQYATSNVNDPDNRDNGGGGGGGVGVGGGGTGGGGTGGGGDTGGGGVGTGGGGGTTGGGTTLGDPSGGRTRGVTPRTAVTPPADPEAARTYDEEVRRYASNPGYEWLLQPQYYGAIAQFRNEAISQGWNTSDPNAPDYIDIVDWFANTFIGQSSPLQGRAGWDTYRYNRDGTPRLGPDNIQVPYDNTPDPNRWQFAMDWYSIDPTTGDYLDQQGQRIMGRDGHPLNSHNAVHYSDKAPPVDPNAPPVPPAPPTPPAPPVPPVDPNAPPPAWDPIQSPLGNGQDGGSGEDLIRSIYGLLQPTFGTAQKDYLRQANANNALVGGGDAGASGGYAVATDRGLADLVGGQSGKVADIAAKASEAAKDRQLTREGLRVQQGIAQMQADIDRLKITTDDELQRWLNDPNNDTIAKYGIDKNDLLQRYQANLGAQANASASMNRSGFSKALGGILSSVNQQQLQFQRDQMMNQYNLGLGGLDVNRENNLMNFILGMGGLGQEAIRSLMSSLGLTPPGTVTVKP